MGRDRRLLSRIVRGGRGRRRQPTGAGSVTTAPRRVLLIGLDGASFRLLQPLITAGELPELARLMDRGCHGELRSIFPSLTPPAWSTVVTGKNPGKHGIFS